MPKMSLPLVIPFNAALNCKGIIFCLFVFLSSDNMPLSGPEHEHGRRQGASDLECDGGEREMDPIQGEGWSSDTLKILSSMPSRTIGESCNKQLLIMRRALYIEINKSVCFKTL